MLFFMATSSRKLICMEFQELVSCVGATLLSIYVCCSMLDAATWHLLIV
jgi:hypothetical protein